MIQINRLQSVSYNLNNICAVFIKSNIYVINVLSYLFV